MKKIAIIGSCVSRNLFNDERLVKEYEVGFYSFQTNIWDMFSKGLDISTLLINQFPTENFNRRMINYDLNKKTAIDALLNSDCEYVMIDMFNLFKPCLKVTLQNKSIYLKNTREELVEKFLKDAKIGVKTEIIKSEDVNEKLIQKGLEKLANFLKQHFDEQKIIINYPVFCKRFWNLDGKIVDYSANDQRLFSQKENLINKWSNYLATLLPKAKKFKPAIQGKLCSCYVVTDNIKNNPNPVHLSNKDMLTMVTELINVLEEPIQSKPLLYQLNDVCEKLQANVVKQVKNIERLKTGVFTSLNYYVNNILDLSKHIVLISAKNQASQQLNKFFAKSKINLEMNFSKSQSYIAVINKLDNFLYEQSSDEKVEYKYVYKDIEIELLSHYKENLSSIKVKGQEYSTCRRGLNIVILNNKNLKVIDSFYCDTYIDENLLITPHLVN